MNLEPIIYLIGPTLAVLMTAVCGTIIAVSINTHRIGALERRVDQDRAESREDLAEIKQLIIESKSETIREFKNSRGEE